MHIAEHLAQIVTQARLVTFHDFRKGGFVPGLAAEHQYLLEETIRGVSHSGPRSSPSGQALSARLRRGLEKFKPAVRILEVFAQTCRLREEPPNKLLQQTAGAC